MSIVFRNVTRKLGRWEDKKKKSVWVFSKRRVEVLYELYMIINFFKVNYKRLRKKLQ